MHSRQIVQQQLHLHVELLWHRGRVEDELSQVEQQIGAQFEHLGGRLDWHVVWGWLLRERERKSVETFDRVLYNDAAPLDLGNSPKRSLIYSHHDKNNNNLCRYPNCTC